MGVNPNPANLPQAGGEDPFPTTVRKLADALNVEPDELMEVAQAPEGKAAA